MRIAFPSVILRIVILAAIIGLFSGVALGAEPLVLDPQNSKLPFSPNTLMVIRIIMMCIAFIIAIVPHEVAHGYAAEKLGDPTARKLGRITFNPLPHVDPVMTLVFPAVLILSGSPIIFGGAKPVPVNPQYFKDPRRGMAIVAIAGPMINFAIATFCIAIIPFSGFLLNLFSLTIVAELFLQLLFLTAVINLFLGAFNLIPVPPLDGGRIAVGFLPIKLARPWSRLEPFGFLIVIVLLLAGLIDFIIYPVLFFLGWLSRLFL